MIERITNLPLRNLLRKHEGNRLKPYLDCCGKYWRECQCAVKGNLTIGTGRNLDDIGISEMESAILLGNDIDRVLKEGVDNFPWFKSLSMVGQDVVLSMLFNMGLTRFKGFQKLITALINGNRNAAADQMLNSKWASQVKSRATELVDMMRMDRYWSN